MTQTDPTQPSNTNDVNHSGPLVGGHFATESATGEQVELFAAPGRPLRSLLKPGTP